MQQLYPVYQEDVQIEAHYDALWPDRVDATWPVVAVNMVSSIDGKITIGGEHQSQKLGSRVDRALMLTIRSQVDAVLRGAETVRQNPSYPGVSDELALGRKARGQGEQPRAIIASGSLELPWDAEIFGTGERPIILTTEDSDDQARRRAAEHAEVLVAGEERLDISLALDGLKERFGIERLLVEGGASLNDAFFRSGRVDLLFWTLAPIVIGHKRELTMVEGEAPIQLPPRFVLRSLLHHDAELYFCWAPSPDPS